MTQCRPRNRRAAAYPARRAPVPGPTAAPAHAPPLGTPGGGPPAPAAAAPGRTWQSEVGADKATPDPAA
ncbi:hypothetical protein NW249_21195, partial [Streptomyces sp. OUCMDZ-4982]|nr:hypothetical protein [Streptomyces sp. OUCMDZ-4982]